MVQDLLSFLRPLSPFKSQQSKSTIRRPAQRQHTRSTSTTSFSTIGCVAPLVRRKHRTYDEPLELQNRPCSRSSYLDYKARTACFHSVDRLDDLQGVQSDLDDKDSTTAASINAKSRPVSPVISLAETVRNCPDPVESQQSQQICQSTQMDDVVQSPKEQEPVPEPIRTRDSEVFHISHLRHLSASRPQGHWTKLSKVHLTKRERQVFRHLRNSSTGPVKKSQVLTHCNWFPSNVRKDSGHRPLKLAESRYSVTTSSSASSSSDERWEEDPFSGEVWSVRWVPDPPDADRASTSTTRSLGKDGRRVKEKTIFTRLTKRSEEQCKRPGTASRVKLQKEEISTIRLVQ